MKLNNLMAKYALEVIIDLAQSVRYNGSMLNERYLHHCFSHILQEKYNLLDLAQDDIAITLHPEWPTYKKQTGLDYGRYKREDGRYRPHANGTAGFIDFAVGDYHKPDVGIEFSLKYGWSDEEIVYDFLKLLDKKNPFKVSISLNIIFRHGQLVNGEYLTDLEKHIDDAFRKAVERLSEEEYDDSKELYLIIAEIDKDSNRRHWHYDKTNNKFENGLPFVARCILNGTNVKK